ncbi:MAG: lytic transglycosylase domain-containing protein [Beijerinckiaceae bacterium]|nr:lytic transglycosylase domain-containing protein [Beijerinckiaceae bacterium]
MVLSAAARLLACIALLMLLAGGAAMAGDDGDHRSQQGRPDPVDVETTAAFPSDGLRLAPAADPDAVKSAIAAYRRGALGEGDAIAAAIEDRAIRALLEWVAIRSGATTIPFNRLNAFLQAYPNYPATTLFRRRAEEALIAEKRNAATIRVFFHGQRPVSPAGRVALARALKADGETVEANDLVRQLWRQDHLGEALEKLVLAEFGDALTNADHRLRAERYIFRGNAGPAQRNAARVSADYVKLAQARLASGKAKRPVAPALIASVPPSMKGDISYAFLLAQQARRQDKPAEAARALANVPRDPALLGDGDEWWIERRLIARKLLDSGEAALAYQVAAGHGAEGSVAKIDAEWHAGFIALRFRQDAAAALTHFSEAAHHAETPVSVSRAAYWQGRAYDALGRGDDAIEAYERAAEHPIAYYGQLARARLGLPDLPLRRMASASLEALPGFQGVRMLYRIGARDLAATLLGDLAQRLHTTPALEAVAAIAAKESDARGLLTLGKQALHRGFPLDMAAFPTNGVPDFPVLGDPMERAVVHAIARQESAFDPTAISHAGARGLMQMMPATARETARRASLPFDWPRLGQDAHYSARMGAAHLNDLLKDWRGSYILTFAAYNAGSGNVKKWIEAYGDPRRPEVDAIDWVERIPFYETRNYVQRVMENVQVYRQRLNQRTAFLIDHDLKRGGKRE